jgi:hypothetical protein
MAMQLPIGLHLFYASWDHWLSYDPNKSVLIHQGRVLPISGHRRSATLAGCFLSASMAACPRPNLLL